MDKFSREQRSKIMSAIQEHERLWSEQGWKVIIIWECALKTNAERERTFAKVDQWLQALEGAQLVGER